LISDIVRSIAVIPDEIIGAVYLQECSSILGIAEKVLYSEINKIRKKKHETDYKRKISPEDNFKSASPSFPSSVDGYYAKPQEKEIIRLLLHYADKVLYTYQEDKYDEPRDVTVAEYTIREILNDELEFKNLVYKQIFQEYLNVVNSGEKLDDKHFIYHQDPEISQLAADLLSTTYTLSKIFEKGGARVATEDMKLKQIVPETIITYKRKILEIAQSDIKEKIKDVDNKKLTIEEVNNLQKDFMKIASALNAISKDRWVVFK
jgi:DNA primase